ncbi:MAG: DNA-processing protein DprA [Pseudomonadota bacterium]
MLDTDSFPAASPAASLADWLRLAQAEGVGGVTAHQLLALFGSPRAIFEAGHAALRQHVSAARALALCRPAPQFEALLEATLAWQAQPGRHLITLDDPRYPAPLRQLPDAPLLLYAIGRPDLLGGPAMAIVGSRNASAQGAANAAAFGQALSAAGLTIVSGLALGIDAAAHQGGLRAVGSTVAVVGTGADRIYPSANAALAHQIAEQGCIVSEYSLGTPPARANFPRRNRIISGLASGVLVVEAAARSGSLITARQAGEQGRDVFAIPGSIHAPLSKGCHRLIREGAKLVESAADVLGELAPPWRGAGTVLEPAYAALLDALGHAAVDPGQLAALAGIDAGFLASQLLMLELGGHVERLPGGLFQRVHR